MIKTISYVVVTLALVLSGTALANFASKRDGEFITISGKVKQSGPHTFILESSEGTILVEMDDYDWELEGYNIAAGDRVIVNGKIDHDPLETKKIEADRVYVKHINTYFYASHEDEEDAVTPSVVDSSYDEVPDRAFVRLQGIVKDIDKNSFEVYTGTRRVKVDVRNMSYDPLDNVGSTQVDVGEKVFVTGYVDQKFFTRSHIDAAYIKEL